MEDILIREVPLPYNVKGYTIRDANGDFNVYINTLLSPEDKNRACHHELSHIRMKHLDGSIYTCAQCEEEVAEYIVR